MADIEKDYTFKIPDEMFVDDFSGNKTHTFTYKGPDKLVVTLPNDNNGYASAYTQKLDGPVYPNAETQMTIDLTDETGDWKLAPIADLLWGREYDLEATFDEVTLDDGTIYQEHNNFTIHDIYWKPRAKIDSDGEFESWDLDSDGNPILEPFVRDTLSPKMRTYLAKADMFIEILDQFALSTDDAKLLTDYKAEVETYRSKVALPWKYKGSNPFDLLAPKIPMELVARHKEIVDAGLEHMQGEDPNSPVYD